MSKKLPFVQSDIPRDLRMFLDRVRELVSGSGSDRLISLSDVVQAGIGGADSSNNLTLPATAAVTTPPAPTGLAASGALQNVVLTWDNPRYPDHAFTEVWGASTNVIGTAVLIGQAPGAVYSDALGFDSTRYYWIRFKNTYDEVGAYNAVSGVVGTTGKEVPHLLDVLTGQIKQTQLFSDLSTRIDLIDGTGAGSVNARVATETTNRTTAVDAVASTVTTLSTTVAGHTSAIATEVSTRANETGSLFSKYTVKIDSNGYVSGFGLASTANTATPYSEFAIRADKFYIASPSGPGINPVAPFVVTTTESTVNGVTVPAGVYMDAAYIKNGTITNAKIGDAAIDNAKITTLDAAKITTGYISANRILAGSLDAKIATLDAAVIGTGVINAARIGDGTITNAKIGNFIASTDFNGTLDDAGAITANGNTGWAISKSGLVVLNSVYARGDIQASSLNAATGTFSGSLNSANGTFTGTLQGATGTFSGELAAGTVDVSKLVGQTSLYSSPGTFTLTVPASLTSMRVILVGAGGGGATAVQWGSAGGSPGGGGGGGGVSIATFNNLTPGQTFTLVVGAGGAGSIPNTVGLGNEGYPPYDGHPGGDTYLLGVVYAYGGGAGKVFRYNIGANGGAGGSGTTANGYSGGGSDYTGGSYTTASPFWGGNSGLNYGIGGAVGNSGSLAEWGPNLSGPPGKPGGFAGGGGGGSSEGYFGRGSGGGGVGANGRAIIEFFNPNGVIIRSEWNALITALQAQGLQVS